MLPSLWAVGDRILCQCGVFAENLPDSGVLKAPMLKALPATFSWPHLITALIGGGVALLITPVLRKALRK